MATVTRRRPPVRRKPREMIVGAITLAQQVVKLSDTDLWMNFDREADVLYVSLKRQQQATETVEHDDGGILVHYRGNQVVGITVLNASRR